MKKIIPLLLFAILHSSYLAANIIDAFCTMPAQLTPTLSTAQKLSLVGNYQNTMDTIANQFYGIAYIDTLDTQNGYIKLHTTYQTACELQLIPTTVGDTIIGYVHTIEEDAFNYSALQLFDTQWNKITVGNPTFELFLKHRSDVNSNNYALFKSWQVPLYIEYQFVDGGEIRATLTALDYIDDEQKKIATQLFASQLTLHLSQASNSGYILKR